MQIDPADRTVKLGIREFAGYRQGPRADDHTGGRHWRAQLGQQWHRDSERLVSGEAGVSARFECPLEARWRHRGWTFEFHGRVDQWLDFGDRQRLREVKSVDHPLPAPEAELFARYPEYFVQAAAYLLLARALPGYADTDLDAALQFIDISSGVFQEVILDEAQLDCFQQQLEHFIPFLEDRRQSQLRLHTMQLIPPFEHFREGQEALLQQLRQLHGRTRMLLVEAPTGFGKTGILLDYALSNMQAGQFNRLIYLTGKSTGQLETIRQVRAMTGDRLRFIQMRNRSEHAIDSPLHTCTADERCNHELGERWATAGVHPPDLFVNNTLDLERAKAIGRQTGICPHALTRTALAYAEVWIGDYNYLFSPASQSVFIEQNGLDHASTIVLIDEAHNLADRVADSLSVELSAAELAACIDALHFAEHAHSLLTSLRMLREAVADCPQAERLGSTAHYTVGDALESCIDTLHSRPPDYAQLDRGACKTLWKLPALQRILDADEAGWLFWSPEAASLRLTCLDPSDWIQTCLARFAKVVFTSATLSPVAIFKQAVGIPDNACAVAVGHAPWREGAYRLAIDVRVDTRLRFRSETYPLTAQTVARLCQDRRGQPVAVFFASYRYAEAIKAYLGVIAPGLRCAIQPRGVPLDEQEHFIRSALLGADALFLILGSGYTEAIDHLGGQINTAMVVGPGLPEVNPVQKARIEVATASGSDRSAFDTVYIHPGSRKIRQALGRLVRAPGQHVRVLLHDRRFAEDRYRGDYADECEAPALIRGDADLEQWLEQTSA